MKRFKKLIILAFVLIVIVGGVMVFFALNSKPDKLSEKEKKEAIENILGRKANLNPNIKAGNGEYLGKYSTFKYPNRAKIYTYLDQSTKNNDSVLETFSFDLDQPRLVLNYSVASNTSKYIDVHDIPAVKLRDDKSRGYLMIEISAGGQKGLAYSRQGGGQERAEKVGFFLFDGRVYTFAVLGNNYEDTSKQFDEIINSLTLK